MEFRYRSAVAGSKTIQYKETLRPPLRTLFFIYFLLGSLVVAIWAALPPPATQISFILSVVFLLIAATSLTSEIIVRDGQLFIGKAHIETKYISDVISLDKNEMALERTRRLDPAAHLALKFWEPKGVKILLNDHQDATPYWLVTTKHGSELAAAIKQSS
jgi:hypothetical protein